MLKYCDLGVSFDEPKVWTYDGQLPSTGKRFQEILEEDHSFQNRREEFKKNMIRTISEPIDVAKNDQEIGLRLDPIFERLGKGYFFSDSVNQDLLLKKANKNTLQKKLQSWCYQLNQNVPAVKSKPGIKIFFDQYKNVPCVVVCAGPSLKNAVEQLKKIKGKALIMAVDTSFRSLIKRDIEPDFVNAHDANENGKKFFAGIKTRTVAAFVNYIHPATVASYDGPLSFYYVEDEGIPTYKTMAIACDGADRTDGSFIESRLIGGSSVAHTAMYLAIELGCNPITFVGLDLSFPDLSKSHFESDNMKNPAKDKLLDVMGINGRKVKTNLSFYSYKTVFDRMAPTLSIMQKRNLYTSSQNDDGSMAGVVHAGLEPMPFDEWISKYATSEREELKKTLEIYNRYL